MSEKKKRLGDILVELNLVNDDQIQEALNYSKENNIRLGQALVDLKFVTEENFIEVLGMQLGIPHIDLDMIMDIPSTVLEIIPEQIIRNQIIFPVSRDKNTITIATADPWNYYAIEDIKLITHCEVKLILAPRRQIEDKINEYFGKQGAIAEMVKNINQDAEVVEDKDELEDLEEIYSQIEKAPVIKLVNLILTEAINSNVSDIHLEPYERSIRLRYRKDGILHEITPPPKKFYKAIVSRLKIMSKLDIAERRLPQDGRMKFRTGNKEVDIRVSIVPVAHGEKVVLRLLDKSNFDINLKNLGMSSYYSKLFERMIKLPYGLILVTGPTGSGKSTTLYAVLTELNSVEKNLMSVEDPIEYQLKGINQVQVKSDIGLTFASGLRSFLRQDPDIIMVGEVRDRETAEICINSALTGHLVLSTLHTNDAPSAINRLMNMGIEPFLINASLVMVVAQRLVRKICNSCKTELKPDDKLAEQLSMDFSELKDKMFYYGKGCESCLNTGYNGRTAIYEIMVVDENIKPLIKKDVLATDVRNVAIKQGMRTLRQDGFQKVLKGLTTVEELLRVTSLD